MQLAEFFLQMQLRIKKKSLIHGQYFGMRPYLKKMSAGCPVSPVSNFCAKYSPKLYGMLVYNCDAHDI